MPQQELSDQEALDFLLQPDELSDEQAVAFLTAPDELQEQQTFPSALSGAYSGIGSAIGSGLLKGGSAIAGFAGKVIDLPQTLLGGVTGPATPAASKAGAKLVAPAEQALEQKAAEIFPPEERERLGMYGSVMETFGQMGSAAPFVAAGAPAAAFVFAAQNAMPAYYEVLKKTGSEEAANKALWGNAALGQLEFLGGGEKIAGGLLKKLMTGDLGKAIRNGVLHFAVTEGKEVGTELAQQGLSDLLHEHLTGEDLENWKRLKATAPVALLASAPFAVVDSALGRRVDATKSQADQGRVTTRQAPIEAAATERSSTAKTQVAPTGPAELVSSSYLLPSEEVLPEVEAKETSIGEELFGSRWAEEQERIRKGRSDEQRKLLLMSPEEMEMLAEQRRAEIKKEESDADISELSRKLDKLQRRAENPLLSRQEQDEAQMEADELEAGLTPDQQRVMFGIGETKLQPKEIEDVARMASEAKHAASPEDLVRALKYRMTDLSNVASQRLSGKSPEEIDLSDKEIAALAVLRQAQETADLHGWNWDSIQKSAMSAAASRFSDPDDAVDMLAGFLKRQKPQEKTVRELKLLRGKEKAEAGPATNPAPAVVAPETVGGPEAPATTQPEESQAHVRLAAAEATQLVSPSSEGVSQAENTPTQAAAEETVPEAEPETQTTGIKNATVERELKKMGMPLPEKAERESFVEWHSEAMARTKKDADAGRKLVDDLAEHPRAVDENEKALLSLEANKRITEREEAEVEFIKEPTEANKARVQRAKDAYKKAADVFQAAGTTSGRALAARKMMIARDESLAAIERSLEVAKGSPLTEAESKRASELHRELNRTRKEFETYVSESEAKAAEAATRAVQLEAENVMLREKRSIISKKKRKDREAKILESKKRIDEILNKLASGQRAAAGLDPAKIGLTVQLAAEHIRLGYQSFSLWAEEVVARVGEHIRPYLRPAWDQAKEAEEQAMLKSYKSRKETDIAKIEERIATKRFDIKKRQTPIEKDPEAIRLKAEYERAKRRYGSEKRKFERGARTKTQKLMGGLYEIMALPRALRFSYDLPPVFRQGMFFGVQDLIFNPIAEIKRIGAGIGAASLRKAERIDAKLRIGRVAELAEASGLDLPSVEEEMSSEIAKHIPGIQASSRIYNTYMNLQRMAKFEAMTGAIPNLSMHEAKQIARGINILTGRGNAKGGLAAAIDGLGSILTSPRLLISRFQMLGGAPMYGGTGRTRRAFARQYAKTLAAYAAFYSLAKMAGELFDEDVEIHWDQRTSDFGKIIVGEKRYDVMGGLAQITTLLGRTLKGEKAGLRGKNVKPIRGEDVPFKGDDATDLLKEFLRYKLSPTAGAVVDIATGKQVERDEKGKPLPVTAGSVAKSLTLPVSVEDIPTEMRRLGVPGMVQNRLISAFGVGVRDYYGELKRARR